MASAESSHDIGCGRNGQPSTLGRSFSERRGPVKAVAHKSGHRPDIAHKGAPFQVFSRSADAWVEAEIVKLMDGNLVRVEYEVGEYCCGKTLHLHSEHLVIPANVIPSTPEVPSSPLLPKHHCPVMQGCRANLPISANSYYSTVQYLLNMVREGDVALIKGSWLLHFSKQCGVLPRRQDLPVEAFWSISELEGACTYQQKIEYVSISHCWYTRAHPDPDGYQVQDIALTLEAKLQFGSHRPGKVYSKYDLAIFWCWCSFFQEPRSPREQAAFERSMKHMDLWYTNACIEVWMLTKVPKDADNSHPYDMRGWTTWERTVAQLLAFNPELKIQRSLLDLGLLQPHDFKLFAAKEKERERLSLESQRQSIFISREYALCAQRNRKGVMYFRIWDWLKCQLSHASSGVPLDPQSFKALICTKYFTKGPTDLDIVATNYYRNFQHVMGVIKNMSFGNFDRGLFGDDEITRLCRLLPLCTDLRCLNLEGCSFSGVGAKALFAAIPCCSNLRHLRIAGHQSDDAMKFLADLLFDHKFARSIAEKITRRHLSQSMFISLPASLWRHDERHSQCRLQGFWFGDQCMETECQKMWWNEWDILIFCEENSKDRLFFRTMMIQQACCVHAQF